MKIGIDIRNLSKTAYYSSFIIELIKYITNQSKDNSYIIYSDKIIDITNYNNTTNKILEKNNCIIKENIKTSSFYNKENNDLIIFTDFNIPLFYKGKTILIIESLKKLIYPTSKKNKFSEYIDKYLFIKNINKTKRILTIDKNSKKILNENYNINENKISILPAFFNIKEGIISTKIDIKLKHNIKKDYLVYQSGIGSNKNIIRLIESIKSLHKKGLSLDLVLIGDDIYTNKNIKKKVNEYGLEANIHFVLDSKDDIINNYYKQSIGFVIPSIYESFPFCLNNAISYNIKILSSNIESIKDIFGDNISYMNPISSINITNNIEKFILEKNNSKIYDKIITKYNIKTSSNSLISIINNI